MLPVLMLLLLSCEAYNPVTRNSLSRSLRSNYGPFSRGTFTRAVTGAFVSSVVKERSLFTNFFSGFSKDEKKALILSCGDAGKAIAKALEHHGYDITIATTKSKRIKDLARYGNVVYIPQIETKDDEILTESIVKSNLVILADTMKIFSPSTIVRTSSRIKRIIDKTLWKGTVGLVSTENAYGVPKQGELLYEDDSIYADAMNRTDWKMNFNVQALQIRYAEQALMRSATKCFVLRTAGIWSSNKFKDVAIYTSNRKFNTAVGESYISFATDELIAYVASTFAKESITGVYNVANFPPMKRKLLLRSLHAHYGLEDTVWTADQPIDPDILFCVEPTPYLPNSQRGNSRLVCNRLRHVVYGM
jgi:hypothetical protein